VPAVQWNASASFIVIAGVKLPNSPRAGPTSVLVELTYEFEPLKLFTNDKHGGPH
jgi:hypothetical protein